MAQAITALLPSRSKHFTSPSSNRVAEHTTPLASPSHPPGSPPRSISPLPSHLEYILAHPLSFPLLPAIITPTP